MELLPQLTISNITFALGTIGIMFSVYKAFRTPQEELDKRQTISEKDSENKSAMLAQQLEWEKSSNERRFKELSESMSGANLLATNHVAHMDVKIDALTTLVSSVDSRVTQLATIIDERIPRKNS